VKEPSRAGRFAVALTVGASALLSGCGSTDPDGLDRVTIATTTYLAHAAMFIAKEQGLFEAEGLDVELEVLNRSGSSLPSLAQGGIDAAGSGPLNSRSINLIQRGARLRLVATRTVYATEGCVYAAFVARPLLIDSGRLVDVASMRDFRITTERTASNYYYFNRLLATGGLSQDDVDLIDMPVAARLDALEKGMIDVTTATEPWVTRLTRAGVGTVWRRVSDVLPDHDSSYIVFGKRFLDERRDLGVRFLRAYLRAAERLRTEGKSPRNIESIARWSRFDRQELRAMCWPPAPVDPRPDPRTLAEYQEFALERGLIDRLATHDELVDLDFLDEIEATGGL
jgi:NitT/TauT family transport system substrate-binding protein